MAVRRLSEAQERAHCGEGGGDGGLTSFHEQSLDGVESQLLNWSRWVRAKNDLGMPHEAAGCVGGGYSQDFEDELAKSERITARLTDQAIEDLGEDHPGQRLAIYITWGVTKPAVWRFQRGIDNVYAEAKVNLVPRLRRRGVWLGE